VIIKVIDCNNARWKPETNFVLVTLLQKYVTNKQDRQRMCICDAEVRLCNHCCSGKAVCITHSECVCVWP
jgi:hypothetical protein